MFFPAGVGQHMVEIAGRGHEEKVLQIIYLELDISHLCRPRRFDHVSAELL